MVPWILENFVLPLSLWPTQSRFWSLFRQMQQIEVLPPAELHQLQLSRLHKLLHHAERHVPYYRKRWQACGVTASSVCSLADLARLPCTSKVDIQRNFPEGIVDEQADRTSWQYVSTRGTANRLVAIHDFAKRDLGRAAQMRSLYLSDGYRLGYRMTEIPPDACSEVCGEEGQRQDSVAQLMKGMARRNAWRDRDKVSDLRGALEHRWLLRKQVLPPFGSAGSNPPEAMLAEYVEQLETYRPHVLKGLPTYLQQIARYVHQTGRAPLPVPVVKPFGGSVSPVMREQILQGFAGEFRDDYGSAELGPIACDCRYHNGMHLFSDLFVVEIVRGERPCSPGEVGRILITDLGNFAMPMIRYEIGDLGRLFVDACPCGRTAPRLVVEGRLEDALVTDSGELVSSDAICDAMFALSFIDQFQLVQEGSGEFELLLVPRGDATTATDQAVVRLRELLGSRTEIQPHVVSTIPAEESGKFRFVKSAAGAMLGRESVSQRN